MPEYDGPNLLSQEEYKPFDHHCPFMGSGLNCHWDKCLDRMQTPAHKATCYPTCKYDKGQNLPCKKPAG